jgi:imidazoleglycerol-phosphate dehydratase
MKKRTAKVRRKTRETTIQVDLCLDGKGETAIDTGMPFFDHMLELAARHALVDLRLQARGDLEVDYHHTVEDIGLVLGTALDRALGTRRGIRRYGFSFVPMDEALSRVAVDLGGRPYLVLDVACRKRRILDFDLALLREFLQAFTVQARMNLHVCQAYGAEAHHAWESVFKALGRALREACAPDPRETGVPSSKGAL